jgi:LPS export ABC transporter protein LptC
MNRWKSFINLRGALLLGLILAAGLAAWGLWGRPAAPPPPPPPQVKPEAPARPKMESLELTEVDEGSKRWTLEARSAEYLQDRDEIRINGIRVEFFSDDGRVLRLSCEEGLINTKTRSLTLQGQVMVQDGDLTIKTGMVRYEPEERLLIAPDEVVLESPRAKVQGKDLKVDLAGRRLTMAHHGSTEIKLEGRKWPL